MNPPPGCVFHPRCAQAGPRCKVEVPRNLQVGAGNVACHLYDGGVAAAA
jgi:peptide/nickel transport system ATP-binding protein